MTTPLWRKRAAYRFAQLLDEAEGLSRRHRVRSPHDDELTELVSLRHQLVDTAPPEIDREFRTGLRAMLVATAEREGIGSAAAEPALEPPRPPRTSSVLTRGPRTRSAVVAGVAVGAVAFAGMSTASANAVPGDALYGVKRSTERAQLALASSNVGRAQLYLDFARTRLAEARTLTGGDLDRVLEDMDRDTQAGVQLLTTAAANRRDRAALDPVDHFVVDQRQALQQLATGATGADQERVAGSLELLDEIEDRATQLRRNLDLDCPSATSVDALGPLPGACVSLPAPDALDPGTEEGPAGEVPPATDDEPVPPGAEQDAPAGTPESPAAAGDDEQPAEPGTTPDDEPDPVDEPGDEPAGEKPDEAEADDDGLLGGLNRLLGNLLGG